MLFQINEAKIKANYKMKKIITTSLIALFVGMTATAQDKKVAVFDPAGKVDEFIKEIVREEISAIIVNTSGYTVLERQLINKVLEENQFQSGGLVDDSQISVMGKRMGANMVFVSSITRMSNSNYYVSCKMIDVQTARIERQQTTQTQRGSDDLIVVVQRVVKEMFAGEPKPTKTLQQASKPAEPVRQTVERQPVTKNMLVADGKTIYMNGRELSQNEVRQLMAGTDALRLYNKGIKRNKNGNAWIITGGCLLAAGGVFLSVYYNDVDNYWDNQYYGQNNEDYPSDGTFNVGVVCLLAGGAATIVGIPLKLTSSSPVREAVDMHNSGIRKTSVELNFGFTQNGIGLALKF
jgi:hypothetical protein